MKSIINILVDGSTWSKNALAGFSVDSDQQVIVHELNALDLDGNSGKISELVGAVIVFLGPETFSLYRGKLYQMLSQNKNIHPFEDINSSAEIKIPRWSYVGEYSKVANSTKIGLMTYVGCNSTIAPNSTIGSFVWIGNNVSIGPGVTIGNNVTLHDGMTVGAGAVIDKFNELRNPVLPNANYSKKRVETDFFGGTAYMHGA
jgi:hypothetical protein